MLVCRPGSIARMIVVGTLMILPAWAEPPLTTIQDVLYRADGTRFNGIAVISWQSFEASDTSNIPMQMTTVQIVNGNLRVRLVPTTNAIPPGYYSVKYNSDGRVQFEETWAVPPSNLTLRVRDVRLAPGSATAPSSQPLQEVDIVGLSADLAARPIKGTGYVPGRAVFVGSAGTLESVVGDPSDCVRVDGSSGPCGTSDATLFIDGEVPSGIADGSNASFALAAVPNPPTSLTVYRNGVLQKTGLDYTTTNNMIQFAAGAIPQPGDTLLASYRLSSPSSSPSILPGTPQVLCSALGAATAATSLTSLGSCSIPPGVLQPGDRLEVRFDFAHQGTGTGFTIEVRWGETAVFQRTAAAGDGLVTGRMDAAMYVSGGQLSFETWGTVLPFGTSVNTVNHTYTDPAVIDLRGVMLQTSSTDGLTLVHYTVLRYPRV